MNRKPFVTARTEFKSDILDRTDFQVLIAGEDGQARLVDVSSVMQLLDGDFYNLHDGSLVKITQNPVVVTVD